MTEQAGNEASGPPSDAPGGEPGDAPSDSATDEPTPWHPEQDDEWAKFYTAPADRTAGPELGRPVRRDPRRTRLVVILTLVGCVLAANWFLFIINIGNGAPMIEDFGWFMVRIIVTIGYLVYLRKVL